MIPKQTPEQKAEQELLERMNLFINGAFRYEPDYEGFRDFDEAVRSGAKCYDFARHKRAGLEESGFDGERLKYLTGLWNGKEAHTVLGVYDDENPDDPLVLDNTSQKVVRLSQRADLSFMSPLEASKS